MIMPKDTLGFIGRDNLLTSSGVFTDCADKYVLIAISQKSAFITSSDFEVISDSQEPIMVLKVDSPSDEDIEYCGTNNIYKVRLQLIHHIQLLKLFLMYMPILRYIHGIIYLKKKIQ